MGIREPGAEGIHVRLLGRIEVRGPDREVRLAGRQAQALLALLAIDRRRRPREAIAADLWPDAEGASTACLRQALWLVKSGLSGAGIDPEHILEIEPDLLGLRPEAVVELDVTRFETLARARPAETDRALRLYGGDLAEGLGHECFATERERLSDLYEDVLALAAEERLARGDLEGARDAAERLLARDALREEGHAVLIAVFGEHGTRSQVVRQYLRLRSILRRELEVEPLPETEAAYRQALAATVERSRQAIGAGSRFGGQLATA